MSGGIKGYPSSQKLVKGAPSAFPEFATLQPQDDGLRAAIDTAVRFAFRVDSDTVPRTAGAGTGNGSNGLGTVVADTSTPAKVGDFVRFIDGAAAFLEVPIVSVETNAFLLGARLDTPPASGDQFYIMRYATQRVSDTGSQIVTVTQGPIQFVLDGADVEVEEDTGTPANSIPLPVKVLDASGVEVGFATEAKQDVQITELQDIEADVEALNAKFGSLGQKNMAGSAPVVIASDQSPVPVSQSGTWNINDISGTVSLPTGASTLAEQQTQSASLVSIDGKLTSPLTVQATDLDIRDLSSATDSVSSVQSGVWNITNISGTVSLPTGAATEAKQDVQITELQDIEADVEAMSGKLPATLGQKAMAASLSVVVASDQSPVPTSAPVNSAGSYAEITNLTTVAQTFTAPANAVGFVIEALSDNTNNVRYKIGATATTSSGMRLEPGRSENFNTGPAADISVIAESGTNQVVTVQWILSQ